MKRGVLDSKKAAIEMSITTIIVIVLGVTLLVLGLTWVRGIFSNLTSISEQTFTQAQTEIGKIQGGGEKLSIPLSINVKQGATEQIKALVYNDGSKGQTPLSFTLALTRNTQGVTTPESKVQARLISNPTVKLSPGDQATYVIQVVASGDAPLTNDVSYNVVVNDDSAAGDVYATSAFAISIEKSSLFGGG